MNSIEEKLWNYIDGTATAEEQQAISLLIEQDEVYRKKYQELLALNAEFAAIELDEPPMAFTYNVMESIRNEHALVPLKSRINTNIIKGIGLFFVLTISAVLIIAVANVNWSASATTSAPVRFALPDFGHYLSSPLMQGFLFLDLVLGLYIFDSYLRKKSHTKLYTSVHSGGQQE
jgi:anti-sigma factor RsiW